MAEVEKTGIDLEELRDAIREEYEAVACDPQKGYHFHTGRPLAAMLGYKDERLEGISGGAKKRIDLWTG